MIPAPVPSEEAARLAALHRYDVLDTEAEAEIDELTQFASTLCDTPIALVSLVDADRQWFKSRVGFDRSETSRDSAFCAHAILQEEIFEVPDAARDFRFAANPLVVTDPNIRFYAGAPLIDGDGYALGTLCVIDRIPRKLSPTQRAGLRVLGRQVLAHFELRRRLKDLQLANAAIASARDAALAASRAKDIFIANMSHELRTPLNALLGSAELLTEDATEAGRTDMLHDLGVIRKSGAHLLAVIEDILDMARLEASSPPLRRAEFAVAELVAELAAMLGPQLRARGLGWRLQLADDLSTMRTDPTRVRQILLNLLANAAKFTRVGEVALTAARVVDGDRAYVLFAVQDTGIGVAADKLPLLFHEFTQVHGDPQTYRGTGLGLALSRRLARALGGDVDVESTLGVGSRFTLRVPVDLPD